MALFRKGTLLFAGICAAAVMGAAGAAAAGEVEPAKEIVFWSTKEDAFADVCRQFTEETGITVKSTFMGGYDDMVNKVMAGIAGRKVPDVAQLGQRHGLAQMYDSGSLLAVEDYISPAIMDDIIPGFWKRFTYKDKKVILPFQNSMPMLYVNKNLLEQAGVKVPETFAEVVEAAKAIKDKTGIYGFSMNKDYPWYVLALMYNSGVTPVDGQGKSAMNVPAVKALFEQLRRMALVDQSMPSNQHQTAEEDFCNGRIAMFMTSCASYKKIETLVDGRFPVGLAQFPMITVMDIPMGGNGLGIFKTTPERQKAAAMFVEFMLDKERVAQSTLKTGYIPVTHAAMKTETYAKYLQDPNRQVVDGQLKYLGGAGVNPADSLVWSCVMDLVDAIEADPDMDISKELQSIDRKVDRYLSRYAGK